MSLSGWLRRRALGLKQEIGALWICARDPRTPLLAKLIAAAVVIYVMSPIDLIPDFIPVLGYLDDVILVPIGIAIALRLIPPQVLAEARARTGTGRPSARYWLTGALFVLVWLALSGLCAWALWRWWTG
jgi:uncharacterized membrane protein YkvA (DUF1232 family)